MTYMRFTPVARNQWEVFTPTKSKKPIANVKLRNGKCSAVVTAKLNHEELSGLSSFMEQQEREN